MESGVKYVINKFRKRSEHRDYDQLGIDLEEWTDRICDQRIHETTQKVLSEVFIQEELKTLRSPTNHRFKFFNIEKRKVDAKATSASVIIINRFCISMPAGS